MVWVTGASDGRPRAGADGDAARRQGPGARPRHDRPSGLARFTGYRSDRHRRPRTRRTGGTSFEGYVSVRARRPIARWSASTSTIPTSAPGGSTSRRPGAASRLPVAGAVFTERGHLPARRAGLRQGHRPHRACLGALAAPGPRPTRSAGCLRGTRRRTAAARAPRHDRGALGVRHRRASASCCPPPRRSATTGSRRRLRREGEWTEIACTSYRVAEYRPPEFLVDVTADSRRALRRRLDRARRSTPATSSARRWAGRRCAGRSGSRAACRRARDPRTPTASTSARPAGGGRRWRSASHAGAGDRERRGHARRRAAASRSGFRSARP